MGKGKIAKQKGFSKLAKEEGVNLKGGKGFLRHFQNVDTRGEGGGIHVRGKGETGENLNYLEAARKENRRGFKKGARRKLSRTLSPPPRGVALKKGGESRWAGPRNYGVS